LEVKGSFLHDDLSYDVNLDESGVSDDALIGHRLNPGNSIASPENGVFLFGAQLLLGLIGNI